MSNKRRFFIACEESNHNCDKSQYNEATFWEKIKLNIHLLYCKICRKYSFNNTKLTKVLNNSEIKPFPKKDKEALKKKFQKELSK